MNSPVAASPPSLSGDVGKRFQNYPRWLLLIICCSALWFLHSGCNLQPTGRRNTMVWSCNCTFATFYVHCIEWNGIAWPRPAAWQPSKTITYSMNQNHTPKVSLVSPLDIFVAGFLHILWLSSLLTLSILVQTIDSSRLLVRHCLPLEADVKELQNDKNVRCAGIRLK